MDEAGFSRAPQRKTCRVETHINGHETVYWGVKYPTQVDQGSLEVIEGRK
jgi:hypothetical protein